MTTGGVRLHHRTFAGLTLVVELPTDRPQPYPCVACVKVHDRKSVHLRLDAGGDVIVSPEIYEQLRSVPCDLEVVNPVPKPPTQFIGAVELLPFETALQPINAESVRRFHRPGSNRYVNRDRMTKVFDPIVIREMERRDRMATAVRAEKRALIVMNGGKRW